MSVFPDSILSTVDWSAAPCINVAPDLFFPNASGPALHGQVREARSICETCPLATRQQCAKRALDGDDHYGVWAGVYVTARAGERRAALAELRKIAGVPAVKRPPINRQSTPRPCAGDCGRMIRSSGQTLAEFPGTISNVGGWRCRPCFDRANGTSRGAA
ncbi:WhiB family transcriptional regulator [Rhodococcus fascians]|nr:WhiB family transcriptional regulator [Rhodococcus fascians]MBY4396927.1 WhiB family transcriptional regulator [Rhodococcus fascians]MBY4407406.1 WhiB family transcriptional regulator [Rhodococcus fascians]MBY4421465.1 WhiB family transcriptional regulator [Rhodococcus fascians]MBY4460782.1 WhiB family transcriptional regulator [Rhodococcus fascians]